MLRMVVLCLVMLSLATCTPLPKSKHVGPIITHAMLDRLEEGKTTKAEMIALFGTKPVGQSRNGRTGTTTLTWKHHRLDLLPLLINQYIPATTDILIATFDRNDILITYHFNSSQTWQDLSAGNEGAGSDPDLGL